MQAWINHSLTIKHNKIIIRNMGSIRTPNTKMGISREMEIAIVTERTIKINMQANSSIMLKNLTEQ